MLNFGQLSQQPLEPLNNVRFTSRRVLKLTNIEFKLLTYLIRNAGRPLSKRSLLTEVWSPDHENTPYLPKVHIQHLRKKIERDPGNPQYILTERGIGYKFAPPR